MKYQVLNGRMIQSNTASAGISTKLSQRRIWLWEPIQWFTQLLTRFQMISILTFQQTTIQIIAFKYLTAVTLLWLILQRH